MYEALTLLAAFVFAYVCISQRMAQTVIGGAITYTAVGLVCGPLVLGLIDVEIDGETLRTLAELTLAMVLFTDSANADLSVLRRAFRIPGRLLLIGLPLTIVMGYLAGSALFPHLSWVEVALLAVMLAPTDAALGQAVVTNPAVPAHIRQGLNVESGLNDGICVPVLLIFLAFASGHVGEGGTVALVIEEFASEIGIGGGVGVVLALLGGRVLRTVYPRGWIGHSWAPIALPALALLSFALAQTLGGSGFIACFVGGLVFGATTKADKEEVLIAAESTGNTLSLLTWFVFGAAIVGQLADDLTWQALLYAVLSLTVIRMLPVFLVLFGLGLNSTEKLFLGWFGPRGLASIVFVVMVLNAGLPGGDTLAIVAAATVVLSVISHGISANPLAAAIGKREGGASPAAPPEG